MHGSLAAENPLRIRRYVQNHVFDSSFGTGEDPAYLTGFGRDSVTELHFENMEALAATLSDPYTREVIGPDGALFNDLPSALALLARPTVLTPPPAAEDEDKDEDKDEGENRVKVLHFVHASAGLDRDTFAERWRTAHEKVVADGEPAAGALRGCVQHRQVPGPSRHCATSAAGTSMCTRGSPPCTTTPRRRP
ncbi:EthD domain-containing protein [Streptomyces adelaidensis]|uniref:EthD domain-containing protein n=1 Tax=Streptomyces adelaidensis TaxID=2796465 RepID=UPI0027DD41AE|nr:EthD domain-containing protein [Streptomyces adelaidensis]